MLEEVHADDSFRAGWTWVLARRLVNAPFRQAAPVGFCPVNRAAIHGPAIR